MNAAQLDDHFARAGVAMVFRMEHCRFLTRPLRQQTRPMSRSSKNCVRKVVILLRLPMIAVCRNVRCGLMNSLISCTSRYRTVCNSMLFTVEYRMRMFSLTSKPLELQLWSKPRPFHLLGMKISFSRCIFLGLVRSLNAP